jgi:hypothetical protein
MGNIMYSKIIVGYVVQNFDDNGVPVDQEFYAGDEVEYESNFGEPIDAPANEQYLQFNMVQPMGDILEEPLTDKQLEGNQEIDVIVAVPLSVIIDFDFESLMDYFDDQIIEGTALLSDIRYDMIGCNPALDLVYFHVEAFAELI